MITIPGYKISENVYESARSLVYRGTRDSDGESVIIKMLAYEFPTQSQLARFSTEYEIIRKLNDKATGDNSNKNTIHVYSLKKHFSSLFMELEDFGANSLKNEMSDNPLSISEFLSAAERIAGVLGFIHRYNIMHKDINPSNIVWNRESDTIKLIDFGISTELSHENPGLLNVKVLEGTLSYMSPEQTGRMNRMLDYRTDFYSAGVMFYQMLTSRLPFIVNSELELVHCHIAKTPPTPTEIDADIPEAISAIVMKMMAKNAEERYQNAYGLQADLRRCIDQLNFGNTIAHFEPGQTDISDKFQIPEKLYGREKEIEKILTTFDLVNHGATELMLVTGYSGIGKSSLIREIHKPIVERKGYFISGKFDQFKRSIPYSAFIEAFEEIIDQILVEDIATIARWEDILLEALGPNGKILADVIPNLELIIGEQPEVTELSPAEAQNRFNMLFLKFVQAFSTREHPLVLFLDDLQWADPTSLKMLELLTTSQETRFLFIIGAYRDNEVGDSHPLTFTTNAIKESGVVAEVIHLGPLDLEYITEMLSDVLNKHKIECDALAELCQQKTQGNPFFLKQLLHSIYEKKLFTFDAVRTVWNWDISDILDIRITDNVVELMVAKIEKLPPMTQEMLKLAACIGDKFDLTTLSYVSGKPHSGTAIDLWAALHEDLVVPMDASYKFVEAGTDLSEINIEYKFQHDRIRQAAHSMFDQLQREQTHIRVGRLMLENTPEDKLDDHVFDIVNHLNYASGLITDPSEMDTLSRLNQRAALRARASAAFEPTLEYLKMGIAFLPDDCWTKDYKLTLSLYSEMVEAAYLNHKYEQAQGLANTVFEEATSLLDKVIVYEILIESLISQNEPLKAVETALDVLRQLGLKVPGKPGKLDVLKAIARAKTALIGKSVSDMENFPEITDPAKLAAVRIMVRTGIAAYYVAPEILGILAIRALLYVLKYGNSSMSPFVYTSYGIILCGVLGDIELGYSFGQLAFRLLDKYPTTMLKARTILVNCTLVKHWKEHLRDSLRHLLEGYQVGLETGDFEFASLSVYVYTFFSFYAGRDLRELRKEIIPFAKTVASLKQDSAFYYLKLYRYTTLRLIGDLPEPTDDDYFDIDEALQHHLENNQANYVCHIYEIKAIMHYLSDEIDDAADNIKEMEKYLHGARSSYVIPLYRFYGSLIKLSQYATASINEQKKLLRAVDANQKKLKKYSEHSPDNHLHKYYLVEAERAKINGETLEAIDMYDRAIATARSAGFINEEALANELAAKFYISIGKDNFARVYIRQAQYDYERWGAITKANEIASKYPELLARHQGGSGTGSTVGTSTSTTTSTTRGTDSSTGDSSTSGTTSSSFLDFHSVIKASQAISGEIVLSELLRKMIEIAVENAGAQRGLLILQKEGRWFIEAEVSVDDADIKTLQSIPIEDVAGGSSNPLVSNAIINYVARTQEVIVLNDATNEGKFTRDRYIIERQTKSVLCLPLIDRGETTGMLYLENNLAMGAFTADRLEVLGTLSSQMAISINNATLYKNLKESLDYQLKLTKSISRFVPYQVVEYLGKDSIINVELGDYVQRDMSIMFADIRNFFTMSEKMTPKENFEFINAYLGRMEPIIREHKGYVDKYIGDGIMALFPSSADDAVTAAIKMIRTLDEYNEERHRTGYDNIEIGIGINSGSLMLGTVGGHDRMDGTVISDSVNLASRVEGVTKLYGIPILVSEQTMGRLRDRNRYNSRYLGKVMVKGKLEIVSVYEIFDGDKEETLRLKIETRNDFEQGLHLYYDKIFSSAIDCFKQVLEENPNDNATAFYLERAEKFSRIGVPEDWDGVETLMSK